MAGYTQLSEILGKKDEELPWHTFAARLHEIDQQVMLNNEVLEIEETPTLFNKQERIFLSTKTPLFNSQGKVIGLIGASLDITERKAMEKALLEEKEKAVHNAKTEFLRNMRHDIRTPLAGIISALDIIQTKISDPQLKDYIYQLNVSSYALLALMNEILDVVKITSGQVPLHNTKFKIKDRLEQVIHLNQAKAQQKDLNLVFHHDENIPTYVIGDALRVHRIALELVTNALNFTEKGSVQLTLELVKVAKNRLVLKLIVEDTGIGIAKENSQEVFLQFKRLTPAYEEKYKGFGLGLSIVKQFIDELEAEIYLESEVGVGSKFTCLIPFKKPLLDEDIGAS